MDKLSQYKTVLAEKRSKDGDLYEYRLLMRNDDDESFYSFSVNMKSRDRNETSAMVYDVCHSFSDASAFFRRLVSLLATPINLPYVVEDEF